MKAFSHILWLIFGGIETVILWVLLGALWCVTVVGIPCGLRCIGYARYGLWPFGKIFSTDYASHPVLNALWMAAGGFLLALLYLIIGFLWCLTIIGIPFGLQSFKLAKLSFFPFGVVVS